MSKHTYKRGTIGYAAQALANKHGKSTQGIFILSRALELALSSDDDLFHVTGVYNTRVHERLTAEERDLWKSIARGGGERDFKAGKIDCPHTDPEYAEEWRKFNNANPANLNRTTA